MITASAWLWKGDEAYASSEVSGQHSYEHPIQIWHFKGLFDGNDKTFWHGNPDEAQDWLKVKFNFVGDLCSIRLRRKRRAPYNRYLLTVNLLKDNQLV